MRLCDPCQHLLQTTLPVMLCMQGLGAQFASPPLLRIISIIFLGRMEAAAAAWLGCYPMLDSSASVQA